MFLKKFPGSSRSIAAYLRRGSLIAYPTEYCYGLGCDPRNRRAVQKLLKLKQRPQQQGLILIADKFGNRTLSASTDLRIISCAVTTNHSGAKCWYCRATWANEKIIHNSWMGKW